MRIAIAGDCVGSSLVDVLLPYLSGFENVNVKDISRSPLGANEVYAEVANRLATGILSGEFDRGILCCGTGIGMAISANKVPGIRAAVAHDTFSAERAAKSNNVQIVTLGSRVIGPELAKTVIKAWLSSEFDPMGASATNVAAINDLDRKFRK